MKFSCSKNILSSSINITQKAVTGKTTMPILQGILLKADNDNVTLIASDNDLSIETNISCPVEENGSIVVDAKLLGEIVRRFPNDTINISTTDNSSIEIICQKSKFTLICMNAEDFPNIPQINENAIFKIPQKTLKSMIRGTIFSTAQDETRPILTGILFEIKNKKLNMVALDGYRLALMSEGINDRRFNQCSNSGKNIK